MHTSRARSTKGIAHLEEHQPEEGEHGRDEDLLGENRDIACRCMSIVERPTGMTEEFPEIAEFKKNALRTALGTPDSALFQGFTRRNGSRSEPMGSGVTETVHGREGAILDKKGITV